MRVGTLCIVVKTIWPDWLGKIVTCVNNTPHPLGSLEFEFLDGVRARGEPANVRPITPPDGDVATPRERERETT